MMQIVKNLLKNTRGFSLTEVIIGSAILTGVALTTAQLFKNERGAQKKIELEQKLTFYHQNLSKILNLPVNCFATLSGAMYDLNRTDLLQVATPQNPIAITNIYACETGDCPVYGQLTIPANSSGTPLLSAGTYIDKTLTWKVKLIEIVEGRVDSGIIKLRITYEMNPKLKTFQISKEVFIYIKMKPDYFGCDDPATASETSSLQEFCENINGDWDDETEECVQQADSSCPPGQILSGVDSNGEKICQSANEQLDPTSITSPAGPLGSCPSPSGTKLQYDPVTKKFEVLCDP